MKPAKALPVVRDLSGVSCVGYCRVSTLDQATEDKSSLSDQRKAISAQALTLGRVVGEWFEDSGISGATAEKRPDFQALIASCEAHPRKDGLVLVLNDSRFGRWEDAEVATYYRVRLSQVGWRVRFCEGDDVENTLARGVMRFVGQAQASEYRLNLQRNTRRGMRGSSERGFWTREAPYGYRRQVVNTGEILEPGQHKAGNERVSLAPHEKEAGVVRRIFEQYATGRHSIRSLTRELAVAEPAREWSPRAVSLILLNRVYCGDVVSGRRSSSADSYGKDGAHPAIINRALYDRVQARLKQNQAHPRSSQSDWLVSGLVTCPDCGEPYSAGGLGSRRADGSRTRFYADRGGREDMKGGKRCHGPTGTVSKHLLEGAVLDTLGNVLTAPATQRRIAAAVDRYMDSMGSGVTEEAGAARKELAKLDKRRDRLVAAIADGTLEQREAGPQLASIRAQIEAASARIQTLAFRQRQTGASQDDRERLLRMASDFAVAIKCLPSPDLRGLLAPWIASATFNKRTRELTLAVRRVPAVAPLVLSHSGARGYR